MPKTTAVTHLVNTEVMGQIRRANPGECHVHVGDSVRFANTTNDTIKMNFSSADLFGIPRQDILRNEEIKLEVKDVRPGGYPYSIFCMDSGQFAEGSSMPIIIVEPKT